MAEAAAANGACARARILHGAPSLIDSPNIWANRLRSRSMPIAWA